MDSLSKKLAALKEDEEDWADGDYDDEYEDDDYKEFSQLEEDD